MSTSINLNTIGSEFEQANEKVVHVHDGSDAVWVSTMSNGEVLFCFEDSVAGTVRSVRLSREQWDHLASLK
jgi:hypothetical protein